MADVLVWLYNSRTGTVVQNIKPLADISLKSGLGWHGPFGSKDDVTAYYEKNKAQNPGWKAPTGFLSSVGNLPGAAVDTAQDAATKGLGLTDDNIRAWMIRIGEILLGIVLIGVGVAKLSGTTNAVASLVKAKI
jgi:hypothetical protein